MGDSSKEAGKVPKGKHPGSEIDGNWRNESPKKIFFQKFFEIDDENWRTLDFHKELDHQCSTGCKFYLEWDDLDVRV